MFSDPKQVSSSETLLAGFSVLFNECLRVRPDDSILVIFDEAFRSFLDPLVSFFNSGRLQASFMAIPKAYQRALVAWSGGDEYEITLPRGIVSACRDSSIVVNCLDGDLDLTRLRGAILHTFRANECRFAHVPGISEEVLAVLTSSPIEQIVRSAENVAWVLGEAQRAELISSDPNGQVCRLTMELDGWDNEPMMSPGVIYPNSWGNVPPGEVFCCPDHERVSGTVCITGSIPGRKLGAEDATIVEFEKGRLVRWLPQSSVVGHFLRDQMALAAQRQDENWNVFAELGVGLNPAVKELTGNELLDEKALGTVHVAIGNNKSFGHKVKSYIHADMLIVKPTLLFDGFALVDEGVLRLEDIETRRRRSIEPLSLPPQTRIHFKLAKLEYESRGALRRLVSAGRLGYVPIIELASDRWLEDVIHEIREESPPTYSQLQAWVSNERLDYVLAVLHHYRILTGGAS